MNRFDKSQVIQPIDTMAQVPWEFLQGKANSIQKQIDDTFTAKDEAAKLLDFTPGMLTRDTDAYREYVSKYNKELESYVNELSSDSPNLNRISTGLKNFKTRAAIDPIRKIIDQDFLLTQEINKKYAGSQNPYIIDPTQKIKKDSEGNWMMPDVSQYLVYTDKDLNKKAFDQLSKLHADLNETIKQGTSYDQYITDPVSGNLVKKTITPKTKEQVETLKKGRVEKYLNDLFLNTEQTGEGLYNYMSEAVKAGNPNLAKDNTPEAIQFRKNIFNKIVAPSLAMVYEKRTNQDLTTTTEDVVKNNGGNKSNGSGNNVAEKDNYNILPEQVLSNQFYDSKSSLITSPGQIDQTIKENGKNISTLEMNIASTLIKDLGLNEAELNKLKEVKSGIIFDDENGLVITPQAEKKLGDLAGELQSYYQSNVTSNKELFKQIQNLNSLETANKNLTGFKKQIEEISGVENYDENLIESAKIEAINKTGAGMFHEWNTNFLSNTIDSSDFLNLTGEKKLKALEDMYFNREKSELYNKEKDKVRVSLSSSSFDEMIDNLYNEYQSNIKEGLKGKPEYKVYETLQQYQNRQSRVEVQWLNGDKQKDLQVHIQQKISENSLELIDPATNKPIRQTDEIATSFLEKTDSGSKFKENVRFGLFVDPEGGYRGMIKVDGKRYEYKLDQADITNFKDLDDGTKEYYKLINQAYSSLKESFGQDGRINIGGREISIKEEVDKSGQSNYIYTTPDGKKQTTNDISNIINQYITFGQTEQQIQIIALNIKNRKEAGQKVSDQELQFYQNFQMGKNQSQSQGNRLGL